MRINRMFKEMERAVFSFEVFPPKNDTPIEKVEETLEALCLLKPDYISVTYGANGSQSKRTAEVAGMIKNKFGIEPLPHLTALYNTGAEVIRYLQQLEALGVQNILALRGDRIEGEAEKLDFYHASDLASFIRKNSNLNIVGACYPECHPESKSLEEDIESLKKKLRAGVTSFNSQLFFDNDEFYYFRDKARALGIEVPIEAGIMPIVKASQVDRIVRLSGAKVPRVLSKMIDKYADKPEALFEAGTAYAIEQAAELLSNDVDGIHLYVMNNVKLATKMKEGLWNLL